MALASPAGGRLEASVAASLAGKAAEMMTLLLLATVVPRTLGPADYGRVPLPLTGVSPGPPALPLGRTAPTWLRERGYLLAISLFFGIAGVRLAVFNDSGTATAVLLLLLAPAASGADAPRPRGAAIITGTRRNR